MSNQPGEVDPTPKDEIRKRTASLKALMAVQEIAFCLIMQNADLFYFTEGSPCFSSRGASTGPRRRAPFLLLP
jgi:hypothetical protein